MKQAILITAYKDLPFLQRIVSCFNEDFDFFIHIDRKCREAIPVFSCNHVRVFRKYSIEWGSERHLWAMFDLLEQAHNEGKYSYYHIITGSDYPIKPLSEFKSFFSEDNGKCYIEYHALPRESWGKEGGFERVRYYWIGNQWFDLRRSGKATRWLLKLQRKLGFSRDLSTFGQWYGGGGYCSLSEKGVDCICSFGKKRLHKLSQYTHCAEEIFFQTILLNSLDQCQVCEDSLHLSLWEKDAASPKVMDERDYETIAKSNCFFARKFDVRYSSLLLRRIDDEILKL